LTTLVGAVATLLTVITPSEGTDLQDGQDTCLEEKYNAGTTGLVSLDYWMLLLLILMITTKLVIRVKRYLRERERKQGRRAPSCQELERWSFLQPGEALHLSTKATNKQQEERRSGQATPAVQRGSVPRMLLLELYS
jgi:hypothetical protein